MPNIELARRVAHDIATKRWLDLETGMAKKRLVTSLISLLRDTRLYLIVTESDLEALWDDLRKDVTLVDFLLMSAMDLKFRLPVGVTGGYESVIDRLAIAYGSLGDGKSVVDSDTLSRLPNSEAHRQLLKHNGWYFFLLLLETTALFEPTVTPDVKGTTQ